MKRKDINQKNQKIKQLNSRKKNGKSKRILDYLIPVTYLQQCLMVLEKRGLLWVVLVQVQAKVA